jgi:hypothetical protein
MPSRFRRPWVCVSLLAAFAVTEAQAQSAQLVSLQFSGLSALLFGQEFSDIDPGFGGEAQIRFTPSAFSIGGGFQFTTHGSDLFAGDPTVSSGFSFQLYGVFVEPRVVVPVESDVVAPYVSARLSVLRERGSVTAQDPTIGEVEITASATGVLGNAGGGLLFALSRRVNLDLGVTVGYGTFGDLTVEVDGVEIDLGPVGGSRAGGNVVFRAGLAIGLGS